MDGIAREDPNLSLAKYKIDRTGFVYLCGSGDLSFAVIDQMKRFNTSMRTGYYPQAAIVRSCVAYRQISDDESGFNRNASGVLMPAVVSCRIRFFNSENRIRQQDIRADKVFNNIQQ